MRAEKRLFSSTRLLLIMGVPGSGKSSLAKDIVEMYQVLYLDNNFFADAFSRESRTSAEYIAIRPAIYEAVYRVCSENLLVGNSVLLDIPHVTQSRDPAWRDRISQMAIDSNSVLKIVRCFCSEATLLARIRSRGEPRDNWKLQHWAQFLSEEPIRFFVPFQHLDVNTDDPHSTNISRVLEYITS